MAKLNIIRPESANLSYEPESHRLKFDSITIVNESNEPVSEATCSIVVGRGADIIQTLREDIQLTIDANGQYKIPADKLMVELPADIEKGILEADGEDYYIAFVLSPESVINKFFLKKVIGLTTGQVRVKGGGETAGTAMIIQEVADALSIQFPHAVRCEIDLQKRKAQIGRIELRNTSSKIILGGWRAKIAVVSGIDRRFTLVDTIVLPTIAAKFTAPLGPYEADIPRDLIKSEDEWNLELYIVDPQNNQELLFKSPAVSFV